MAFAGQELKQAHRALIQAFPTNAALDDFAADWLGHSLDVIVGPGSLSIRAFDLLQWASARDRERELLSKISENKE